MLWSLWCLLQLSWQAALVGQSQRLFWSIWKIWSQYWVQDNSWTPESSRILNRRSLRLWANGSLDRRISSPHMKWTIKTKTCHSCYQSRLDIRSSSFVWFVDILDKTLKLAQILRYRRNSKQTKGLHSLWTASRRREPGTRKYRWLFWLWKTSQSLQIWYRWCFWLSGLDHNTRCIFHWL